MKKLYLSYKSAIDCLKELEAEYPNHIRVEEIGQTWQKRPVLVITLTDNLIEADQRPALFYTGVAHAREWIGLELAVAFARYVTNNLTLDRDLSTLFNSATVYMIPCLNPDGFELTRDHFSKWRKNRRKNKDGSWGVDLNRNFPIGFISQSSPSSSTYSGPEPFSEPETQALRRFVESHPNITIALDYHSHGNVFFPAHDFRHEDSLDTTDLNVLCANMAEEIRKVSGREYGIHQGKPPGSLVGGSAREYYRSLGILSTVVEVGTRNISDYLTNMSEHVREHIPALISALREVPNYGHSQALPRIENFQISQITANSVTLSWDPIPGEQVSYELYRSRRDKNYCLASNRVVRTHGTEFHDEDLQTATDYYYYIRAVSNKSGIKSPYAPRILLKTLPDNHEFFKILYPAPADVGSVSEKLGPHSLKFGINSIFVGVNLQRGVCLGLIGFPLNSMPENARVLEATVSLYPINRVPAQIERYGEWNIGIIDPKEIPRYDDFDAVLDAPILQYVGQPTKAQHLTQGIWRSWKFSNFECQLLEDQIAHKKILLKMIGPTSLPLGRDSQMMMWDVGYGKFGYGLPFRPKFEVLYTLDAKKSRLSPCRTGSVCGREAVPDQIIVGHDSKEISLGYIEFDLGELPEQEHTVLISAHLTISAEKIFATEEARFHVEFVKPLTKIDAVGIGTREIIERIGHDLSSDDLRSGIPCRIKFDSFELKELDKVFQQSGRVACVVRSSTAIPLSGQVRARFLNHPDVFQPELVVSFINKRRRAVGKVRNLQLINEKGRLKLTWNNPKSSAFRGVLVVKNPHRKPLSPYDGQKLYGGRDEYTYDSFGALDIPKYFGVFTYDDVPNFSKAEYIRYKGTVV
ncbi:MAG: fibronectin type III domain-containing protein [Magnetococcales bacterium]|nr:fibronectin type III domain-containing protein [Magnetococcales bacterium]